MSKTALKEKIKTELLLLDGAMGTEIIARGAKAGVCNDLLNIESPNIISDVHNAYLQAGSDIVITNTFGANKFTLARYGLTDKVASINKAGAEIARAAAGQQKYVLGDIGPSGDFLEPLGNLKTDELRDAYIQQAKSLIEGGVDGIIIETMTALDEISVAIEAAKLVVGDVAIFASMTFDKTGSDYKTMMGVDIKTAVETIISLGVDAVGFNCGTTSLDEYVEIAGRFVTEVRKLSQDVAVFAEPNAGKPELVDGKAVYHVLPDKFAETAEKINLAGINIIGGCCGTTPKHIEAVARRLKNTI